MHSQFRFPTGAGLIDPLPRATTRARDRPPQQRIRSDYGVHGNLHPMVGGYINVLREANNVAIFTMSGDFPQEGIGTATKLDQRARPFRGTLFRR